MRQLDLTLDQPTLTGQAALRLIPAENLRRLLDRGLVKPGRVFYCLHNKHGHMVWSGRGQLPGWVRQWRDEHGNLDALEVSV
jgi:DNA-binding protein H-NS